MVTPQDDIYIKLTKVDPLFVACNETGLIILVAQDGQQDKHVEVILPGGRLPLYRSDPKGAHKMRFKFAPEALDLGFDESAFEWSRRIKMNKIGRISIYCRNKRDPSASQHVRVLK